MFALTRQIQITCDQAKNSTGRLIGRDPPKFEDNETTVEQLQARISKTLDYLAGIDAAAFEGAEDRQITIELPGDLVLEMDGGQLLRDWALPNFYFHLVTAYDILRKEGAEIGKKDYLARVGPFIRQRAPA